MTMRSDSRRSSTSASSLNSASSSEGSEPVTAKSVVQSSKQVQIHKVHITN